MRVIACICINYGHFLNFSDIIHDIHRRNRRRNTNSVNPFIAPIIVVLMAMIVILICCCFLRINPNAPHSDELEAAARRVREVKYANEQWGIENGLEMDHGLDGSNGIDNEAFRDEDAVSSYTATTELSQPEAEGEGVDKKRKNRKRPYIRTNPHVSKESALEKKAKRKASENILSKYECPYMDADENIDSMADQVKNNQPEGTWPMSSLHKWIQIVNKQKSFLKTKRNVDKQLCFF